MKYWLINAFCGVVVLVLLAVHMTTMHLDDLLALATGGDTEPLAWTQVSDRGKSRLMSVAYVTLLGAALIHGLYGLHTMLTERWPGRRAAVRIRVGCWSLGLVLFAVGSIGTILFHLASVSP